MSSNTEGQEQATEPDDGFFLAAELIAFMVLIFYNMKKKLQYEQQHSTSRPTDQLKQKFYQWSLKSGIARTFSIFILLFQPFLISKEFSLVFRRFIYILPCFVWNFAYTQVLSFFCNLYFQGIGGDWQKCFNITYDFSTKILYGVFAVITFDGIIRQDHIYFLSNALIIVATLLMITICSLIFFSFNICQMISNLSDYQNMQELVKVKNKTQQFTFIIGLCYSLRISFFYIYAFDIRSEQFANDSWIIIIDILLCEIVSYIFSIHHRIEIGQHTRETHSLEMQNYLPTPFLDSQNNSNV